jgi:hypothetical protein
MSQQTRPLYEIAREIKKDWQKVYFGAVPYLDAMLTLNKVSDNFYEDSGKSIVLYFLSNASSYRGENAKRIKKELKELCK